MFEPKKSRNNVRTKEKQAGMSYNDMRNLELHV